ncbi:unnamed protein product [Closterium sp. Yama58-4]|nr:unnamed protein product [Closterium sp. Yama58-4]
MCCGGTAYLPPSLPLLVAKPTLSLPSRPLFCAPSPPSPHQPVTSPSDLLCSLNGHVLWRHRLPSPVTAVAGCLPNPLPATPNHLSHSLPPTPDTSISDLLCSLNGHVLWRDRLPSPVTATASCPTLFLPFCPPPRFLPTSSFFSHLLPHLPHQMHRPLTSTVPSTVMCCGEADSLPYSLPWSFVRCPPQPPCLCPSRLSPFFPQPDTSPSDLLCSLNGQVLWRDRLPSPVTAIAGCDPSVSSHHPSTLSPSPGSSLWAVACANHSLLILSSAGRRLLPEILLDSPAVLLSWSAAEPELPSRFGAEPPPWSGTGPPSWSGAEPKNQAWFGVSRHQRLVFKTPLEQLWDRQGERGSGMWGGRGEGGNGVGRGRGERGSGEQGGRGEGGMVGPMLLVVTRGGGVRVWDMGRLQLLVDGDMGALGCEARGVGGRVRVWDMGRLQLLVDGDVGTLGSEATQVDSHMGGAPEATGGEKVGCGNSSLEKVFSPPPLSACLDASLSPFPTPHFTPTPWRPHPFLPPPGTLRMASARLDASLFLPHPSTSCLVRPFDHIPSLLLFPPSIPTIPPGTLQIASARLLPPCTPVVTLLSGRSFLLHPSLHAWMPLSRPHPSSRLSSNWRPPPGTFQAGGFRDSSRDGAAGVAGGALTFLSRQTHGEEAHATRAHLENALAACRLLKSPDEFRRLLAEYVRLLIKEGDEGRLREVCQELLGPVDAGEHAVTTWADMVTNNRAGTVIQRNAQVDEELRRKRGLLRTVVFPALLSSKGMQRVLLTMSSSAFLARPASRLILATVILSFVLSAAWAAPLTAAKKPKQTVPLPPFYEEALQKLNASGFTSFVSLFTMYGKTKQMNDFVTKNSVTVLVPTNDAITSANLTGYPMEKLLTIVAFQVIKGVKTKTELQMLPPGTPVLTISMNAQKKPLFLTKVSPASPKKRVSLRGKAGPNKSVVTIMGPDFYFKAGKLSVHTTNNVVLPEGY